MSDLTYQCGFGNHFATEALAGALPVAQNSPQRVAFGLYAEQLSSTAFTAPRSHNRRSWLYRIRPSVVQSDWLPLSTVASNSFETVSATNPTPMRWGALPAPSVSVDWLASLFPLCSNGSVRSLSGLSVYQYQFNVDVAERFVCNADAEMLFIPTEGELWLRTEMGVLRVAPLSIAVVPRGVKFQVVRVDDAAVAAGYVAENFGAPFELPNLGPIGANGLANPRDFEYPVAAYEDIEGAFELLTRFDGAWWRATLNHSPLDVVAWHGNTAPYRYDLRHFNTINSVSFDHCDPSIFTVLTSPSAVAGTANVDFVIFPPRWMVAEDTFRPPWFHRNVMSELMGLIQGVYDAKADGFVVGGASLHNCMSPHGPDAATFAKASQAALEPERYLNTMAFMLETNTPLHPSSQALAAEHRQTDYMQVWQNITSHFNPSQP